MSAHPRLSNIFVGRVAEMQNISYAVGRSRLITLTGSGGVGKSRIATEWATRFGSSFSDSVVFVAESDIIGADGGGIAEKSMVARVLQGLTKKDQALNGASKGLLIKLLAEHNILLVIDNCERLSGTISQLCAELLAGAPNLRILATSRQALRLDGEVVIQTKPFEIPMASVNLDAKDLMQLDCVQLLRHRARLVEADFEVTDRNSGAISALSRKLDGFPLAIEAASNKMKSITVEQMAFRLTESYAILMTDEYPGQFRSLQSVCDADYAMCPAPVRLLWLRIAVFCRWFDLDAAERVCGFGDLDRGAVFGALHSLVSRSILITCKRGDSVYYRLPNSARQYALDVGTGTDNREIERRHFLHVLAVSSASFRGNISPLALDCSDLAAAAKWAIANHADRREIGPLAVLNVWRWLHDGNFDQARSWLTDDGTVAHVKGPNSRVECAWALILIDIADNRRMAAASEIRRLFTLLDRGPSNPANTHMLDHAVGIFHASFDNPARGIVPLRRAILGYSEIDDLAREVMARLHLSLTLISSCMFSDAISELDELESICSNHDLSDRQSWTLWASGLARWRAGDFETARLRARSSMDLQLDPPNYPHLAASTALLARIAESQGNSAKAEELDRVAAMLQSFGGVPFLLPPSLRSCLLRQDRPYDLPSGRPATEDEVGKVVAKAMLENSAEQHSPKSPLTERELEVAQLVAQGLSNQAIADHLVISRRTAEGHMQRIMRKLGLNSRTAVAAWLYHDMSSVRRWSRPQSFRRCEY